MKAFLNTGTLRVRRGEAVSLRSHSGCPAEQGLRPRSPGSKAATLGGSSSRDSRETEERERGDQRTLSLMGGKGSRGEKRREAQAPGSGVGR